MSPDGKYAASVGQDRVLVLYDLQRSEKIAEWPGFKMVTNDGMRFDAASSRLVLSAADDTFKVLEIPSAEYSRPSRKTDGKP